jgi:integrase
MARSRKYRGVYTLKGKKGISYGIDYVHPQTGQQVRKIIRTAQSEADAFEARSIEIADAKRGALNKAYGIKAQGKPVSFEATLKEYLKWSKENKKSWKTDEYRAEALRKRFAGKLLSDITTWTVEQYKATRAKEVDQKTVNKELTLASQVFEKAIQWKKWEGGNPFKKIRFRVKRGKKPGALTSEQVTGVMNVIDHPVKRDMVAFAYYQGWRIGEIRKLRWEDVNIDKGSAWVIDPKNSETTEVPLDGRALEIIKRQDKRSELVFCHKNGKPYKSNLNRVLKRAAEKAGVWLPPRKAWHILRRTWASNFLQAGGDVESLRVQGNWKDATMPLWYAEAADQERRKEIMSKMPELNANSRKTSRSEKVAELTNGKT